MVSIEQRFWQKVDKAAAPDGCWEWTGSRWDGYGRIAEKGKSLLAHRVSYEIANGDIPLGSEIHHVCHNRSCVNPDHLVVMESHKAHGLLHRKRKSPKIDWDEVLIDLPVETFDNEMIRKMVADGVPQIAIARRVGLSKQRINQISRKKSPRLRAESEASVRA